MPARRSRGDTETSGLQRTCPTGPSWFARPWQRARRSRKARDRLNDATAGSDRSRKRFRSRCPQRRERTRAALAGRTVRLMLCNPDEASAAGSGYAPVVPPPAERNTAGCGGKDDYAERDKAVAVEACDRAGG